MFAHIAMPAALPRQAVPAVLRFLAAWRRRRQFKRLLDLDDHLLEDIGALRVEVEIAARRPLMENAAETLRALSWERRRLRQ